MRPLDALGLALAVSSAVPTTARANSVSDEAGVGSTQTTPVNPRSGFLYDRFTGVLDLADNVALRAEVVGTHDIEATPQHGAHFNLVGREIFSALAGLEWDVDKHVSIAGEGFFTPKSTASSDAQVPFGSTTADALIQSVSSAYGFTTRVGYDTASDSPFQTAIDGSFSFLQYISRQTVVAVDSDSGPVDIGSVITSCYASQQSGCDQYINAASQRYSELDQYRAGLSISEDIYKTDLGLSGAYYWYDHDPRSIGYFSLAALGTTFGANAGLPSLAPLQFTVRPGIGHAFGRLRINAWYQYGRYAADEGISQGAGLKFQVAVAHPVSVWLRLDGQDDVDRQRNTTLSALVALGLKVRL
jgi:hypothetical protein